MEPASEVEKVPRLQLPATVFFSPFLLSNVVVVFVVLHRNKRQPY